MKIMFYFLRPFDELPYCERFSKEFGIEYNHVFEYPTPENVILAEGCDAVSTTPCDMGAEMLERFAKLGVKYLCGRSIGYDHIDLVKAKELGMRVSNASYPPQGVANYAVMLILMSLRKIMPIMKRADLQDYSLEGKMGRDISYCTIGVIGTGRIGAQVAKNLSGFGCRILAHDLTENASLANIVTYVEKETLFSRQLENKTTKAGALLLLLGETGFIS